MKIKQIAFETPEIEKLCMRMAEALHFLTVKVDKPARIQNAERIENAIEVLAMTLAPYEAAVNNVYECQHQADIEFAKEMNERMGK